MKLPTDKEIKDFSFLEADQLITSIDIHIESVDEQTDVSKELIVQTKLMRHILTLVNGGNSYKENEKPFIQKELDSLFMDLAKGSKDEIEFMKKAGQVKNVPFYVSEYFQKEYGLDKSLACLYYLKYVNK